MLSTADFARHYNGMVVVFQNVFINNMHVWSSDLKTLRERVKEIDETDWPFIDKC